MLGWTSPTTDDHFQWKPKNPEPFKDNYYKRYQKLYSWRPTAWTAPLSLLTILIRIRTFLYIFFSTGFGIFFLLKKTIGHLLITIIVTRVCMHASILRVACVPTFRFEGGSLSCFFCLWRHWRPFFFFFFATS